MTQRTPLSRRTILAAAALGAASIPLGTVAAQEAAPGPAPSDPWRGLKMGIASYSFRGLGLDACIKGIQRIGVHYVSIKNVNNHLALNSPPEHRKAVAQKFRDAGITPLSCGNISIKNDEADARIAFEYARDIGVPTIVCAPDPAALPLLDKLVKEYDIRLAIHNHGPGDKFPTPTDVWKALDNIDPRVGLCIDVGHTARGGDDPVADIRNYKARLYDLHLKDVSSVHSRSTAVEVELGRGVLDVPGMLRALLDIGYAHHVGLEHEKDARDPIPGVAESIGYAKGVMRMINPA